VYLDRPSLPTPTRQADHVRWTFAEPLKVETPGPNSRIREVRQFRDHIELTVYPWADLYLRFEE
jgi:hypothetical protein